VSAARLFLLALLLVGCDRPKDVSDCYRRCVAIEPSCSPEVFQVWNPFSNAARLCRCTCDFPAPFAVDGSRP